VKKEEGKAPGVRGDQDRSVLMAALRGEFDFLWQQTLAVLEDPGGPPLGWRPTGAPKVNPLSVLVTHICGADRFWVGEMLTGRSVGRVRANEFSQETATGSTHQGLVTLVETTRRTVEETLSALSDDDLVLPVGRPPGGFSAAASSHPLLKRAKGRPEP
jgi:hypothetical protein